MPSRFLVKTPQRDYEVVVERGCLRTFTIGPAGTRSPQAKIFIVTTRDVWDLHGSALDRIRAQAETHVLFFPGGEPRKRLSEVEVLAEQMVEAGGDRSSLVIAFGGGIVGDLAGFLAAIFMRGIHVIQAPTTLLAQVDAAVGGKTGVNLVAGKNLIGSFHQPSAVWIDPEVLRTLPEREYRAGLHEIVKSGVIRDASLFDVLEQCSDAVLRQEPGVVDRIISDAVRIKCEVVSADERESGLRRILNFGHTFGHALEAETKYERLLHGEAVAWGMHAATTLAERLKMLPDADAVRIHDVIDKYGPLPPLQGIPAANLAARLKSDKKTVGGKVHFVLPVKIGEVEVVSGIDEQLVLESIQACLP